jgi:hypothetical protein
MIPTQLLINAATAKVREHISDPKKIAARSI